MGPPGADLALCSLHQVARLIPTDDTLQVKQPTTLSWHAWAGRDENPVRAHHASPLEEKGTVGGTNHFRLS